MKAPSWAWIVASAALACAPAGDPPDQKSIQEGRTYTAWLYGSEYQQAVGALLTGNAPNVRQCH